MLLKVRGAISGVNTPGILLLSALNLLFQFVLSM